MRHGVFLLALIAATAASAQTDTTTAPVLTGLKAEAVAAVDDMQKLTQEIATVSSRSPSSASRSSRHSAT